MLEELKSVSAALGWSQAMYTPKPKLLDHQLLGKYLLIQEAKDKTVQQLYCVSDFFPAGRTAKKFNYELQMYLPVKNKAQFAPKGKRDKILKLDNYNSKLERVGDWVMIHGEFVDNDSDVFC